MGRDANHPPRGTSYRFRMGRLRSYRARRRAGWAIGLLAVAGVAAAAVIALPKGTNPVEHLRPGAQVVTIPRTVRMTAARRHFVNDLLDTFVPEAGGRQNQTRALPLVTGYLR